jgi:hydrogenase expression/formation protein HypE
LPRLPLGKLPIRVLEKTVAKMTGAKSGRILMGPEAGVDFGVIRLSDCYMIVSSDPITGVASNVGWYAVNVSANDVATSGNRPEFMESVIMMPEGSTEADLKSLASEMQRAAESLGISIVGGHTELTPGLLRPIIVVTAFSFVAGYVSSAGARNGDKILMTKTAGLEGTSVLARESKRLGIHLEPSLVVGARGLERQLSVVPEAVAAYGTGAVHGMHDCTEGGVLGAVYEMSLASDVGFVVREHDIPVAEPTRQLSKALSIDPLKLIGSGSMLMAVRPGGEKEVRDALKKVCTVTEVGRFERGRRVLVRSDGSEKVVRTAPPDELWRTLGRLG